jgi:hypothetical protein
LVVDLVVVMDQVIHLLLQEDQVVEVVEEMALQLLVDQGLLDKETLVVMEQVNLHIVEVVEEAQVQQEVMLRQIKVVMAVMG